MASKKITKSKKVTKKKVATKPVVKIDEQEEEEVDIIETKGKAKKIPEIDATDILPEVEEKVIEEESTLLGLEDEESEESLSLDSEELNPFGDKWEM